MKNLTANLCLRTAKVLRCVAILLTCCLFGGCTTMMPEPAAIPPTTVELEQPPLDYYAWVKAAPANELQIELDKLETTLSSYSLIAAVRTSTIWIASELADSKTEQEALTLLARAATLEAETDSDVAYKIFGDILQSIVQQRLDLQGARTTNRRALTEIDSLKKRNSELEQQIEELTSIERQIIERERLNTLEP